MPSKTKIACIGCSYTRGVKPNLNKSYPNTLYDLLKQETSDIEVYNCGITGSSSKLHKIMLDWVEDQINPDVIVYQITNDCRTQIIHDNKTPTAFEINKKYDGHYTVDISNDKWSCLPLYAYLGTVLPKDFNKDNETIQSFYKTYIEKQSILTYQQFLSMCLYKYHYEAPSPVNYLDYIADIDYIHKYSKTKMISFFWENETLVDYNNHMKKHKQQTFNGTSIEQVFQNQNKNINDYSVDLQKHLNTDGNYIVAEWVKENI